MQTVLSDEGCQLRCAILSSPLQEEQLVVARNEVFVFLIFFYIKIIQNISKGYILLS